jgi:hypothetical protein
VVEKFNSEQLSYGVCMHQPQETLHLIKSQKSYDCWIFLETSAEAMYMHGVRLTVRVGKHFQEMQLGTNGAAWNKCSLEQMVQVPRESRQGCDIKTR